MGIKIFHIADVHLGMKFASYPEVQEQLIISRFNTLKKMVTIANKEKCDLFIIAGDLFERVSVAKKDIIYTAQILNEFQGNLLVILPGNHDYITFGQQDLWTHFGEVSGDNILILKEKKVYSLHQYNLDVNLYPAPCYAKHSQKNNIQWIKEINKDTGVKFHIGIAHGSLGGFSPDFEQQYYPMSFEELYNHNLDLWLMGHTHIHYPEIPEKTNNIYLPGTPEPDGFDCQHCGYAWLFSIDDEKKITPLLLPAGNYQFIEDAIPVKSVADLEKIKKKYSDPKYGKTLLKIILTGHIPKEDWYLLNELRENLNDRLFYLHWNDHNMSEEITPDIITKEFTEGSFPYLLLTELSKHNDPEVLQIAYELIQRVKS